jgi:hypothetical protein
MSLTAGLYQNARAAEEIEKTAELALFCKIAAEQGVEIDTLNDSQLEELYNFTMNKTAEEESAKDKGETKDEEDEEKKEAAAAEHRAKLAHVAELQRADELGRKMAHSYVDELNKVGSALLQQQGGAAQPETTKEAAMPERLAKALGKVKGFAGKASDSARSGAFDAGHALNRGAGKVKEVAEKGVEHVKAHKGAYGAGAGTAAGAGAGFAAGRFGKKKESSAVDTLALEHAVKMAHAGGFDVDEVAERLMAANTLDLFPESTKMASTLEQQVELRALELLETVGYPVEWQQ